MELALDWPAAARPAAVLLELALVTVKPALALAAAKAPPPARLLYLGVHSGADVGELQRLLAAQGVYRGEIDNDFGELTRAAVVAFQKRTFTAPGDHDGVVGDKTWAALRAAVKVAA